MKEKCLQLLPYLFAACFGLALDIFYPGVKAVLCNTALPHQGPSLSSGEDTGK